MYTAMASEPSKARAKRDVDLDELLRKMRLSETKHEEVVLAKEKKESLPTVK
jgi:hypothetical protein